MMDVPLPQSSWGPTSIRVVGVGVSIDKPAQSVNGGGCAKCCDRSPDFPFSFSCCPRSRTRGRGRASLLALREKEREGIVSSDGRLYSEDLQGRNNTKGRWEGRDGGDTIKHESDKAVDWEVKQGRKFC